MGSRDGHDNETYNYLWHPKATVHVSFTCGCVQTIGGRDEIPIQCHRHETRGQPWKISVEPTGESGSESGSGQPGQSGQA
jgi:hypothetical protein